MANRVEPEIQRTGTEERGADASTERRLERHVVGVLLPEAQRTPHLGTGGNL
jgi:hypothetical protein